MKKSVYFLIGLICFLIGLFVGIVGCVGGVAVYYYYTAYTGLDADYYSVKEPKKITVDDIVGTYSAYESTWCMYDDPNPIGFPDGKWVIVITKISETKFKIDGSISTTGEIKDGKITVLPTKYKKGLEHININYTLQENFNEVYELRMQVECVGEAIYKTSLYSNKSGLQLYDKTIFLDFRKVADYDYRRR